MLLLKVFIESDFYKWKNRTKYYIPIKDEHFPQHSNLFSNVLRLFYFLYAIIIAVFLISFQFTISNLFSSFISTDLLSIRLK